MDDTKAEIARLERMFRMNKVVIVKLTPPMKRMVQAVADSRHISMNDLVREAVAAHMRAVYPEFDKLYYQYIVEEARRVLGGESDA